MLCHIHLSGASFGLYRGAPGPCPPVRDYVGATHLLPQAKKSGKKYSLLPLSPASRLPW
jgi:hypothetical protein